MRVIEKFFRRYFNANDPTPSGEKTDAQTHELNIATAALLFEVLRADHEITEQELSKLKSVLSDSLQLQSSEIAAMMELVELEVDAATSLYQFTSKITEHFNPAERAQVIRNMWLLAYADKHLDKYEEHLIRKVGSLIHVSQAAFVKARASAKAEAFLSE